MTHPFPRVVARIAAVIGIAGALLAVPLPEPGHARGIEPSTSTFVFTAFPHDTNAVNFWDSWGARRSGGRRHKGVDIMSPRGTEIVAVADGVVTAFGTQRLSGYYIRIDHGDGWATSYMHLNNDTIGTDDGEGGLWTAIHPTLSVGDTVVAGQVIGYVGDSGNAEGTQPHTHFEVKYEGRKINPYPFLAEVWSREQRLPATDLDPR